MPYKDKEKAKAACKKYYETHKEKMSNHNKKYYNAHKEERKEKSAKYYNDIRWKYNIPIGRLPKK